MTTEGSAVLAELWRGPILESVHRGAAVVVSADGAVVEAWGDPDRVILPRSACKMIQALPLVESGAADAAGLDARHLALACASHQGAEIHVRLVGAWLHGLGLGEGDLRCGPQRPSDRTERRRLDREGEAPSQLHNNCSGKHAGFLTVSRHLGAGPDYVDADHPVQRAVREATEAVCGTATRGFGVDGCSAPNFAVPLVAFGRAMAGFARPASFGGVRARAAGRLVQAMLAHPVLVAGEGRCCTALIRAAQGRAVAKTGAEGVFSAILPERGLGIALKVDDGATRAAEAAMAALLVRHGAVDPDHPAAAYADAPQPNRRGLLVARFRAGDGLRT